MKKSKGKVRKSSVKKSKPKQSKRASRTKKTSITSIKSPIYSKRKINMALKYLVVFSALSLISFLLPKLFLKNLFLGNLLSLLSIIFISIATAFFIILLVFFILKMVKKR